MKLLAIDGNSVLNRAFYGIKLLTTKDGRFTNGIYGFMNTLLNVSEQIAPDAVAIAFDLKAPTFRHKMYDAYKAGRKGMPAELAEQLPVLKELLRTLGYCVLESEGYEADDILGTLSAACTEGNSCFILTGDRDSLQLISDNTTVLLASTKLGKSQTVAYDKSKLFEEYSLTPERMIDLKALMGDSSDNIPGVAGVGQKTASDLVQRFGSIDFIYENLDTLDIKDSVREKLRASKDTAYLSRTLGTISKEAPVSGNISDYVPAPGDLQAARALLISLEMFKFTDKLGLGKIPAADADISASKVREVVFEVCADTDEMYKRLADAGAAYFIADCVSGGASGVYFGMGDRVYAVYNDGFTFPAFFKKLLSDPEISKLTCDLKSIFAYCIVNDVQAHKMVMDTSLAGYLINPNASDYSVRTLAMDNGVKPVNIVGADSLDPHESELVMCAAMLETLCAKLSSVLESHEQDKLLGEIEIPLSRVLASMELAGFRIDSEGIKSFGDKLDVQMQGLLAEIYSLAGTEFNVNSPKQLGEILFDRLALPAGKKTKSGYSTNAEVLEGLYDKHPIIPPLLEYRTLTKLKSTYCDGLVKVVDNDSRVHSTLNQTETRTGRISSSEPNLQNIPVRREPGSQLRRFFIANDGCVLVDADYSQIELRVLAAMADDKTMIQAFNNGDDIHAITASQVFGIPLSEVTPLMRSRAKAVNFGIVYGIGAFSLAKDIKVSRAEADRYIKGYLANYSGVASYMENVVKTAKENGYAQTLYKRRRALPELSSSNAVLRAFGERVARNMPIQGTAADIIKIAMVRVCERLEREGLTSRLILQIHDELIVEAPENEAERVAVLLGEEMENAAELSVKLRADVHSGKTWYDAKG
ncbi:MAG: DNA polymerase I [Clostridiales bacterium]|nr:DNA polymerase I [Clostridiales bacterium]